MRFGVCLDRMVIFWTSGDRDLARALADIEGLHVVRFAGFPVDAYKTTGGVWEQRVERATSKKLRERRREKMRRERAVTKPEATCEG